MNGWEKSKGTAIWPWSACSSSTRRRKRSSNVTFNPEEYSLNKDNNFASQAIPGLTSPLLQFVHGNLRTLDMELFFDTFELQDRRSRPDPEDH